MASYDVNPAAVAACRERIDSKQYVLDSDWGEVQPSAEAQNAYLANHSWDDYSACLRPPAAPRRGQPLSRDR